MLYSFTINKNEKSICSTDEVQKLQHIQLSLAVRLLTSFSLSLAFTGRKHARVFTNCWNVIFSPNTLQTNTKHETIFQPQACHNTYQHGLWFKSQVWSIICNTLLVSVCALRLISLSLKGKRVSQCPLWDSGWHLKIVMVEYHLGWAMHLSKSRMTLCGWRPYIGLTGLHCDLGRRATHMQCVKHMTSVPIHSSAQSRDL